MPSNKPFTLITNDDYIDTRNIGPTPPPGPLPGNDPEADPSGVAHNASMANRTKYLWCGDVGGGEVPNT